MGLGSEMSTFGAIINHETTRARHLSAVYPLLTLMVWDKVFHFVNAEALFMSCILHFLTTIEYTFDYLSPAIVAAFLGHVPHHPQHLRPQGILSISA